MHNFVILIDRLYTLDGDHKTIGGIQTYLTALAKVIFDNFNVKPVIYQSAKSSFEIEQPYYIVKGVDTKGNINPKKTFEYLKSENSVSNTLLIWGSDQYSQPNAEFKSINIQHGIGFDTEAMHSPLKRALVNCGFTWLYKTLQRHKAIKIFENSKAAVCVDYNFLNWYRTYRSSSQISNSIHVIPNFTDIPAEPIVKMNDKITIVFARRFVDRRGVDIALKLASKLVSKYQNVEFYFAGDGPKLSIVKKLAESHERIFLTKFDSSKSIDFHRDFSIALVPSIGSEGTSLSLLEAMASNCAVVASNVGGMTNIILNNFNGSLVPPTFDAFYKELCDLIENKERLTSYQKNAYITAKSSFSKANWEEEWAKVLNLALK
ncbi:glycosyltransferase family 4 protein [Pseudoalteromonas agarivorans]|uniref:glycosyltransferase family 4 protein n=1 Tax=Pseudoalteromonas agarivorans TaxID=176102 RepID=UPI0003D68DB8|nr:glycosyltransferase family 4 protein [Pseudoalteromonas agarivorans]ETJ48434.1 glycosyl transferase family 1 [Pseudoalteromonas agarivorans]